MGTGAELGNNTINGQRTHSTRTNLRNKCIVMRMENLQEVRIRRESFGTEETSGMRWNYYTLSLIHADHLASI